VRTPTTQAVEAVHAAADFPVRTRQTLSNTTSYENCNCKLPQMLHGLPLRLAVVRTPAAQAAEYVRAAADLVSRSSSSGGSTPAGGAPLEPLFCSLNVVGKVRFERCAHLGANAEMMRQWKPETRRGSRGPHTTSACGARHYGVDIGPLIQTTRDKCNWIEVVFAYVFAYAMEPWHVHSWSIHGQQGSISPKYHSNRTPVACPAQHDDGDIRRSGRWAGCATGGAVKSASPAKRPPGGGYEYLASTPASAYRTGGDGGRRLVGGSSPSRGGGGNAANSPWHTSSRVRRQ